MKLTAHIVLYSVALALLGLIFSLYGHRDFLLSLSNQLWACF